MAHIPDGVLAAPVLVGGAVASVAAVAVALRKLDYDRIPQAAVLASAFFVASLVTVPVGVSSVHLLLNGLMGLLLGWAAVPAVLVALLMQLLFFGYGGLLVLGVNLFNIALPALICGWMLRPWLLRAQPQQVFKIGMVAGLLGVAGTAALVGGSLLLSGPEYLPAGKLVAFTYLPLMAAEALITGTILAFIVKVAPELVGRNQ